MNGYDVVSGVLFLSGLAAPIAMTARWYFTGQRKGDDTEYAAGLASGALLGSWFAILLLVITVKLGFWAVGR